MVANDKVRLLECTLSNYVYLNEYAPFKIEVKRNEIQGQVAISRDWTRLEKHKSVGALRT